MSEQYAILKKQDPSGFVEAANALSYKGRQATASNRNQIHQNKINENRQEYFNLEDKRIRLHILLDERKDRNFSFWIAVLAAITSFVGIGVQAFFSFKTDQRAVRQEQLKLQQLQQVRYSPPPAQKPAKQNPESLVE